MTGVCQPGGAALLLIAHAACGAPGVAVRDVEVPARVAAPAPIFIDLALGDPWQEPSSRQIGAAAGDGVVPVAVLGAIGQDGDRVVATVGNVQIRKSDVYDRILESDRRKAQLFTDLLVLDAVVAQLARQYGIEIREQEIEAAASDEEELLRTQHEIEWGERLTFDEYLDREFGLGLGDYRRFMRAELARVRYRGVVMRYVAMLEDRVEVRFIVHDDAAVLEDARQKVAAGADFATIARRQSTDGSRRDGGLLGPFGRAFRHPIARVAFELETGAMSAVIPFDDRGASRHALVYCVRRLPKRDAPFAELRDEVLADLERAPITAFEQSAFVMQYCRPTSALDTPPSGR